MTSDQDSLPAISGLPPRLTCMVRSSLHAVCLPGRGLARGRQGPPTPRVWVWECGSRDGTATANVRILTRKTSLWVGARHAVLRLQVLFLSTFSMSHTTSSSPKSPSTPPPPPTTLGPLSSAQLHELETHVYSATGRSLLEPLLQPCWTKLVDIVPRWVAPNALTLSGLFLNSVTTCVMLYYTPRGLDEIPPWVLLLCTFGLLSYQALDAIDGKQARRLGCSSPLGELFDHGCDAISIVFVGVSTAVSVRLSTHPALFFSCCFSGVLMFYFAHWQAYLTGTLHFWRVDVTEAQISISFVFLISAFAGVSVWDTQVLGLSLKLIPGIAMMLGAILTTPAYLSCLLSPDTHKKGVKSMLDPLPAIAVWFTIVVLTTLIRPLQEQPCLLVCTLGFACAKLSQRLVVCHMTRSKMPYWDRVLLPPALLLVTCALPPTVPVLPLLFVSLLLTLLDLLWFSYSVCCQISQYLRLPVLTVPNCVSMASPAASHAD
uniref:diacylglycerol cholinephosphotransferase n=1 Tax=Eptatretus burgeri TaxID=7764 RepID=A0A8C4R2C7_EPTBU